MTNNYATTDYLRTLQRRLSDRDLEVLRLLDKLTILSGRQIRRLLFEDDDDSRTGAQNCRRALLRLTRLDVLMRLERRVGGIQSGSEGYCYRLAPAGQRLLALEQGETTGRGRRLPEPGLRFIDHRLAVSELYVRMIERCRQGRSSNAEVVVFQGEPDCWRRFNGSYAETQTLKPDAFARIGVGDDELWWFLELDLGSVSQRTRALQADAYRAYRRSGAARKVMPRVLWCGRDQSVATRASDALDLTADRDPGLFVVTTIDTAAETAMGDQA